MREDSLEWRRQLRAVAASLTCVPLPDSEPIDFNTVLLAAKGGDEEAKNELFRRLYPRVSRSTHFRLATDIRVSRPWLVSRFSTADIVQEVFWSVLGNLESFGGDSEEAFVGYLSTVIRNRVLDAVRYHEAEKRDGRLTVGEAELEAGALEPMEAASASEVRALYETALTHLDPKEQLLVSARFHETATFAELTAQLGYPNETSTRRAYFQAQARLTLALRKRLGPEGAPEPKDER